MVEDMGHSGSELGLYAGKNLIYMSFLRTNKEIYVFSQVVSQLLFVPLSYALLLCGVNLAMNMVGSPPF